MSIELRPYGVACNIACKYCYQQPQRDAGNTSKPYDLEKMKEAVIKNGGGPFVLFGGEPLLMNMTDLEDILQWGYDLYGRNCIQTNGVLITDQHIELFNKYNVDIGISIDGKGELNDVRWHKDLKRTREATKKVESAIRKVAQMHKTPGLIVTLHRGNATEDKLDAMGGWMKELDLLGIKSVRLHLLEVDNPQVRSELTLTEEENVKALLYFTKLQKKLKNIRFDIVEEIKNLLIGRDQHVSCVWTACDPFTTSAVRGVEGDGQASNCGRTNKDGVDHVKSDYAGYERYLVLYQVPQEYGGCKGCRFFSLCKGQCPGTSIDGDWRNRTEHCDIWKELFTLAEKELIEEGYTPISIDEEKRTFIEVQMIKNWSVRRNSYIYRLLRQNKVKYA